MTVDPQAIKEGISTTDKPWGSYTQYALNRPCTVKVITIDKGEMCSLQSHRNRAELWVVLDDGLEVTIDDSKSIGRSGDRFIIPKGAKHRAAAPKSKARFLEVSFGDFDESDVTRFEDKYGREQDS